MRVKALELRKRGYSYREIAKELGCSVYKVHELLAPIESPKSRLKQIAEIANKIDELTNKLNQVSLGVDEVSKKLKELEAQLSKYEKIDLILKELDKLKKGEANIKQRLKELSEDLTAEADFRKDLIAKYDELAKELKNVSQELTSLKNDMRLIRSSTSRRIKNKPCIYIKEDYCIHWSWNERVEGWDMKPELHENKTIYRLNVRKHPLICVACPTYTPKPSQSSKSS